MYIFVCSLLIFFFFFFFFFPILLGDENVSLADHMWIS